MEEKKMRAILCGCCLFYFLRSFGEACSKLMLKNLSNKFLRLLLNKDISTNYYPAGGCCLVT